MAEKSKYLVLNISRNDQPPKQFVLTKGKRFTVGQSGNNNVILYGTEYPKQHVLFEQLNSTYVLNVKPFIKGEVSLNNSKLDISDLIRHDILPRRGDSFLIKLSPQKEGYVKVGDTKIDFSFQYIVPQKRTIPAKSPVYSWTRATIKSLGSDLLFKGIFLTLLLANILILYALKDYRVKEKKEIDITKVPQRLARFIPKPPDEILSQGTSELAANISDSEAEQKSDKKESGNSKSSNQRGSSRRRGSGRGNPVASKGLLGIIGGTGQASAKSGSIIDALVDKGLVADLNNILGGGTNLKVGKNNTKDAEDPLDQLIGTGGSGGIDDILASLDNTESAVPTVTLKKQTKIDIVKPQATQGKTEAVGDRSEESVFAKVNARQGQITYIYNKYLKIKPTLRGKVTIEFVIAANGTVKSARVIESTLNYPPMERELVALIKRLKFEPIAFGDVTFVFPFQFARVN
ncbi:energy transducer TonB [Candidatus Parcubacteria bacterium]|nr:MAG: energy transducer TonB [Candidatus Parcubacteria bacterium]